jgi:hypothetical protein
MKGMLLARVTLQGHHSIGNARHSVAGEPMPRPEELQIVRSEGESAYYLLYCGRDGQPMTDTFHLSLEDAFSQAEFEYAVKRDEWTMVS